jgi:Domain of unknown function (DUF6285)
MSQPHDAPMARELVEAVREFLERDLLGTLEGRLRFHTLVAINALGMVERELELGPAQETGHAARLAELGFGSDAALAAAIRSGSLDSRYDEVRTALLDSVRAKLEVSSPAYPH